jgi:serine protease Do
MKTMNSWVTAERTLEGAERPWSPDVVSVRVVILCLLMSGTLPSISRAQAPASSAVPERRTETAQDLSRNFEGLAKRVSPAVVKIIVSGYGTAEEGDSSGSGAVGRSRGIGAGIIVDPDGYIITNYHVVKGADRVRVQMTPAPVGDSQAYSQLTARGRVFPARVLGYSKQIDLAVLKIEGTGLPMIPIGRYTKLQKGQIVLAFGSPEGLENSVTFGLVSSVLRQPEPDNPAIYIQTDAAINPGNSGGPLIDLDGNIVGINTFIYSKSGGSEGIGFAIPGGIARYVYEQIRKYGHVRRRTIGADLQTLTPELAQGLNLKLEEGVIVSDVAPDSTAERAGLKIQDVIVSVDGAPMNSVPLFELSLYMNDTANFVTLGVMRGNNKLELKVPVYEPANDPEHLSELADPKKDLIPRLGIIGLTVNADVESLLGSPRIQGGVVVAALVADKLAVDSGLAVGDIIHSLKGMPITSVANLRDAFNALKPGEAASMQVERAGKLTYLSFEMD